MREEPHQLCACDVCMKLLYVQMLSFVLGLNVCCRHGDI